MYLDSVFVRGFFDSSLVYANSSYYYYDQDFRLSQIDLVYPGFNHVSRREIINYDQSGNITREEEYSYDRDSAKLVLEDIQAFDYNQDGSLASLSFYEGNTLDEKINVSYIAGFMNGYEFFFADSLGNLKKLSYVEVKNQAYYPQSQLVYDEDRAFYFQANMNPGAIRKMDWFFRDSENDPYELYEEVEFYWSDIATSIKQNSKPVSVSVFPNPSSDYIQFDIASRKASFEIYTSEGKLKMAGTTTENLQIDISNFPAGIYHYTLNLGETTETGSFVKL